MKKTKNILYVLVFLLLLFQVSSLVFVSIQISKLNTKVDVQLKGLRAELNESFTNQLREVEENSQANINQLSIALAQQNKEQESFKEEIDLLKTGQEDFSGIIKEAVKGVVAVMAENSMGSGFLITNDGYIVSNYHVIQNGERIKILTYSKEIVEAEIVGIDRLRDLALLKIPGEYNYLELADSSNLEVGRKVIAIGNPLGLSFTVTEGIISGLNREGPNGIAEYVQTDVPLNPGNSGGPLLDTRGRAVGINNFKIGGAESLGFSLESNSIKSSVNSIAGQVILP